MSTHEISHAGDLYPRVLGKEAWESLPEAVRRCHSAYPFQQAKASFTVSGGKNFLAKMIGWLSGFPKPGTGIETRLEVRAFEKHQTWSRWFSGKAFHTTQWITEDGFVAERQGPMVVLLSLSIRERQLHLRAAKAQIHLGPIRIPLFGWMKPRVEARAWGDETGRRMLVDIQIGAAIVGPLLRYEGTVEPVESVEP